MISQGTVLNTTQLASSSLPPKMLIGSLQMKIKWVPQAMARVLLQERLSAKPYLTKIITENPIAAKLLKTWIVQRIPLRRL